MNEKPGFRFVIPFQLPQFKSKNITPVHLSCAAVNNQEITQVKRDKSGNPVLPISQTNRKNFLMRRSVFQMRGKD